MKLLLLCVGRLTENYLREGCAEFEQRLRRYLPVTIEELKEHKSGRKLDRERVVAEEGERLLSRIPAGAYLVVLDERGTMLSSTGLADQLNARMVAGTTTLALVIGGPYGVSDALRRRADLVLSLSAMTLTHQMARWLLLEQLYRSCTIIRNEPYHH